MNSCRMSTLLILQTGFPSLEMRSKTTDNVHSQQSIFELVILYSIGMSFDILQTTRTKHLYFHVGILEVKEWVIVIQSYFI